MSFQNDVCCQLCDSEKIFENNNVTVARGRWETEFGHQNVLSEFSRTLGTDAHGNVRSNGPQGTASPSTTLAGQTRAEGRQITLETATQGQHHNGVSLSNPNADADLLGQTLEGRSVGPLNPWAREYAPAAGVGGVHGAQQSEMAMGNDVQGPDAHGPRRLVLDPQALPFGPRTSGRPEPLGKDTRIPESNDADTRPCEEQTGKSRRGTTRISS